MEIEKKLIDICADVFCVAPETLSLDSDRKHIDGFDSLAIVQIIAEMQNVFGTIDGALIEQTPIEIVGDFLKLLPAGINNR